MGKLSAQLAQINILPADFECLAANVRDRILSVSKPLRIYIFGSYARGTTHQFSDLDLAIVFASKEETKKFKKIILNSKLFLDVSVDYLFYSIDDFNKKAQTGGVSFIIKNEGKVIYDQGTKV